MNDREHNIVTGAFGYTGRYITQRLLAMGKRVTTLTRRPATESPFGPEVRAKPFNFDQPRALEADLRGASTLYNTYWVRYPHGGTTFDAAVQNSRVLFRAAEAAGVRRIVHVSITNPSLDSPLGYFRGKALVEEAVRASNMSHAIIRPTVIFGSRDILVNNIAFLLRKLPVFALFGSGDYRVQPVSVEDFAELAVEAGQGEDNVVLDAVGPEVYIYAELVRLIRDTIRSRAKIVRMPPAMALAIGRLVGLAAGDVVITKQEVAGLMAGLLVSDRPATGRTRLSRWLRNTADTLGTHYASELKRHYR
jgi:NADH dehydrogenase